MPMRYTAAAVLLLGVCSQTSVARMYQWVNPGTGSVQFAGSPPTWYRSTAGGPRVQVFDHGRLIDDTVYSVPRAQQEALREAAFKVYSDELEALRRLRQAAARKEEEQKAAVTLAREEERRKAEEIARTTEREERRGRERAGGGEAVPAELDTESIERLKAIIREFDQNDTGKPR